MTESSERTIAQELNTWVQIVGIVIAALWAAYTFIYKEIMLPKAAPVNVTVDLQLKKLERPNPQQQQGENKELIAIEMAVSATNPSSREVYLFPSIWIAYGNKVKALRENPKFAEQVNSTLASPGVSQIEKHATTYTISPDPIAIGRLVPDTVLKPNERAARRIVFHVPPGQYDLVEVLAVVPTMEKKEGATLEWKYNDKDGSLEPILYRVAKNGERKEMEKDKDGSYSSTDLGLQSVRSISTLSLWQ
jgi:hypothetical protein